MDKKDLKTRNYCFTINNYTKKDLKKFITLAESLEKHRYICFGLETAPTTGTKHIQGYIQLNIAQRLTFLHNYFDFTRDKKQLKFHIDMANGTPQQNADYCKKDGKFSEYGEPTTQGNRTDMTEIKNSIRDNPKNLNAIIDEQGNNLQQVRFAQTLQPIYLPKRNPDTPPTVYWIFGNTGIGKTRLVSQTFVDICHVSSYKWLGTDYNQNECFLMDDFRPNNLPFETILKITDRYPFTLEFKGSQIPLNSPYIIFTSPKSIDETFKNNEEDLLQLKRRLIEINLNQVKNINDIDLCNLDEKYIRNNVNADDNDF
jgi:hypothetical protein